MLRRIGIHVVRKLFYMTKGVCKIQIDKLLFANASGRAVGRAISHVVCTESHLILAHDPRSIQVQILLVDPFITLVCKLHAEGDNSQKDLGVIARRIFGDAPTRWLPKIKCVIYGVTYPVPNRVDRLPIVRDIIVRFVADPLNGVAPSTLLANWWMKILARRVRP